MLRQFLRRLGLSKAAPAAPAPGSTALVHIYEQAGRCFVEPSDRTRWSEAGYWISTGRVTILESSVADDVLGAAVLAALAASQVEVPVPPRDAKLEAGLFRAMGVRSRRAAMHDTRACVVTREPPDGALRLEPQHNGGTAGDDRGYTGISGLGVELPAVSTAAEVGRAIRAALAHSTVAT